MVKKILVVSPAWIGDTVMAQVLLKLLKQFNSNSIIDVLAPTWNHALFSHMPEINCVIISPFLHGELALKKRYQLAKKLRSEKYDESIVLPNSFKSALIPFLANIPVRIGWLGEQRFGLLNKIRFLDKKKYPRMIDRFAALAFDHSKNIPGNLPYPKFQIAPEQVNLALKKQNINLLNQKILALCPGAEFGPSKRWPPEYFAVIANQKISEGWSVWLFGSKNDSEVANKIQIKANNQCVNLVGKTDLSEAIHLLSLANIVVTNDSGLMHVAAALDLPIIAIYGSTSPEFTPPLSHRAIILKLNLVCQPCFKRVCPLKHHHCMNLLMPDQVMMAMRNLQEPT